MGYTFTGIAIWGMMQSLGEMATWLPLPGAIPQFCARYADDALGFAVGWNVSLLPGSFPLRIRRDIPSYHLYHLFIANMRILTFISVTELVLVRDHCLRRDICRIGSYSVLVWRGPDQRRRLDHDPYRARHISQYLCSLYLWRSRICLRRHQNYYYYRSSNHGPDCGSWWRTEARPPGLPILETPRASKGVHFYGISRPVLGFLLGVGECRLRLPRRRDSRGHCWRVREPSQEHSKGGPPSLLENFTLLCPGRSGNRSSSVLQ